MKTLLIAIVLAASVGLVHAEEAAPPDSAAVDPALAAAPTARPEPTAHARTRGGVKLPAGDLRGCLKLKDNRAIIRCAEGRR